MATISLSLSARADKTSGKTEILIRFVVGSRINQRGKSGVFINPQHWNNDEQRIIIPKYRMMTSEQQQLVNELQAANKRLSTLNQHIQDSFIEAGAGKRKIPQDWLKTTIYKFYFPQDDQTDEQPTTAPDMMALFDTYIEKAKVSDYRKRNYRVVVKVLKRYQLYKGVTLTFEELTPDTLRDFETFLQEEHIIYQEAVAKVEKATKRGRKAPKTYLDILAQVDGSKKPDPRGSNAISSLMKLFRAFIRWANGLDKDYMIQPITHNNPFEKYSIVSEKYGTPFYLTQEERNQLFEAQLSPRLARQRDIFIFQCLIGCRVSDLWAMTKDNIINGAVEYIPRKTKDGRPVTIRVPLNDRAKEILSRYPDGKKLFPFVAQQQYNEDIKEMLKLAGINRMVTILNPTTREEEKRPIYEVASSHMARRTFVGNLYRQVKDPNLVGKLSGHAENSKAFVRYRDIDDDMAKELVDLLN